MDDSPFAYVASGHSPARPAPKDSLHVHLTGIDPSAAETMSTELMSHLRANDGFRTKLWDELRRTDEPEDVSITTVSGRPINLLNPQPRDFQLDDLATGLSNVCRFAGQVDTFYSVAQHSILVASLVPDAYKKYAFGHDFTEGYIGDISRRLKHSSKMIGYRAIEVDLRHAIEKQFLLVASDLGRAFTRAADDLAAVYEQVVLREKTKWNAPYHILRATLTKFVSTPVDDLMLLADKLPRKFVPMAPKSARNAFLEMAKTYGIHAEYPPAFGVLDAFTAEIKPGDEITISGRRSTHMITGSYAEPETVNCRCASIIIDDPRAPRRPRTRKRRK